MPIPFLSPALSLKHSSGVSLTKSRALSLGSDFLQLTISFQAFRYALVYSKVTTQNYLNFRKILPIFPSSVHWLKRSTIWGLPSLLPSQRNFRSVSGSKSGLAGLCAFLDCWEHRSRHQSMASLATRGCSMGLGS